LETSVILVAEDDEHVRESQLRLARVGIEHVVGYLRGGIPAWIRAGHDMEFLAQIAAQEASDWLLDPPQPTSVLDVREPGEWNQGVMREAIRIPLSQLAARMKELDRSRMIFVHCKGGYRSSIASSLLRHSGFPNVANITGGLDAWKVAGLPVLQDASPA
jgi:rhodanese-related sulfurtransferase